jgi:FtsP/CotA-like multicopper oxidase with cupredoxin domain
MLSRRTAIIGALAASASLRSFAQTQNPLGGGPSGNAPPTILQLQRRSIVVNGKPAAVFAIRQPDGTSGITTDVGTRFRVRVENKIDEPSLIHWHGLTPPWQQDGVPGVSGPAIPHGGSADYDFPLRFGAFWMHSHQGLQEQLLIPRSHAEPDRRHGEVHLVDQQRRVDSRGPAIADRQRRAG